MDKQTRSAPISYTVREDDQGKYIEGYFAVFGENYEMGYGMSESIDPHAFDQALGDDVRCLIDHDTRLVLGRTSAGTLTLRADSHGLFGSVRINEDDTDAMNIYARVQRQDVNQCSFGFDILDEETEVSEDGENVHWTIKAVKLYEVSVCTFPAYRTTEVQARADEREQLRRRSLDAWRERQKGRLSKWH